MCKSHILKPREALILKAAGGLLKAILQYTEKLYLEEDNTEHGLFLIFLKEMILTNVLQVPKCTFSVFENMKPEFI